MSSEKAIAHLQKFGLEGNVKSFEVSSATVELAAAALQCESARIAKTLSFVIDDACILIVTAGDTKVDNSAYKAEFGAKATMAAYDKVEQLVGHAVGGVCPFGVNEKVEIYLDESLRRFETVFPACGASDNAVELTIPQLEMACENARWVRACKLI